MNSCRCVGQAVCHPEADLHFDGERAVPPMRQTDTRRIQCVCGRIVEASCKLRHRCSTYRPL